MTDEMKKVQSNFPGRLKALRERKGLTQQRLAEMADISYMSIHYYESGHSVPTIIIAASLANALGVSVDCLIGVSDERMVTPDARITLQELPKAANWMS